MKTQHSFINPWLVAACVASSLILGSGVMSAFGQGQHPLTASARLNAMQQNPGVMADKRSGPRPAKTRFAVNLQARLKATA